MNTRFLLKALLATLFFATVLFVSAGSIRYIQGWIFLVTNLIASWMNYWSIRNDEDLMAERASIKEGAKSWDKRILGFSALSHIASIIIAGLDSGRFHWTPVLPGWVYALGVILTLGGQIIFFKARQENKFFSSVVRIQTERGHEVCDTGIYTLVRHPGYLGMLISLLALPLLTGAFWSLIPVSVSVLLLFVRTYLEDKTLEEELPGYPEYMEHTRKRLIPGIW